MTEYDKKTERKLMREGMLKILIKEKLAEELRKAGFGGLTILRSTEGGLRVLVEVERPWMIREAKIEELKKILAEKYGIKKPEIWVNKVENAALNPQIMAEKLAMALERGWHFRRAGHSTLKRIMEAGAKGAQIIISGKIVGDRAKTEKFTAGKIKYSGNPSEFVKIGRAVAKTKPGIIGVTVKILPPDVKLPDEISIIESSREEVSANAENTVGEKAQGNE